MARPWLMRGLAILLGLVPLVLLEVGLRVFGFPARLDSPVGDAADFDPRQVRPLFVLDESAGRWSIPQERFNYFRPASFAATKSADSRRIFVLGGSTVQGRPYSTETAFSTWLKLRLESAQPATDFEVVNCGGVSYASYRLEKILHEVLRYDPDAIVLYTGHNEFLEDRTYADVRSMSSAQKLISRIGSHLRTVAWIQSLFATDSPSQTSLSEEVDAKLDHVGGLESYHRDPTWRQGVHSHFADTLQRMVRSANAQRVPIILCTPACDLVETPPFKIEPAPTLSESQLASFTESWTIASDPSEDWAERLNACKQCLAIDPQHAGAHYIAGRLNLQQRMSESARQHLIAAADHDVCALRATSSIVSAVHQVAQTNALPIIDTTKLFDQRDSDGNRLADAMADPEFFVDHVHPTVAGHQLIAMAIAQEFEKLGWIKLSDEAQQRFQSLAGDHLEGLGEEYYGRGKQRLEGLRRWAAGRAGDLGAE